MQSFEASCRMMDPSHGTKYCFPVNSSSEDVKDYRTGKGKKEICLLWQEGGDRVIVLSCSGN